MTLIPTVLAVCFALLGLVHLYWGLGGKIGKAAAIPTLPDGRPVFHPKPRGTLLIAVSLFAIAAVAWRLGMVPPPGDIIRYSGTAIGALLLFRGIGERRYLGLLKRIRGTRFATLDTLFYSPFCIASGIGFMILTA
ncbi:DUF3995 domain-containing protein [Lacibacterium aquatile]|uniref:DUF3995 domain-containing protein n=1 Tax=Lacibacterium aquatile TaxID=1168082 RepID=A0ABW5DWG9_9PROT